MEEKKFLEGYYQKLNTALESSDASFIFNKDRSHNATIMRFMFDKSNEVCMYCGSMSVFRKGFYEKIENESGSAEKDKKQEYTAEERKMMAKEAKEGITTSLKSFFDKKGSKLSVIMENFEEGFLDDLIDENLFKENVAKGQLLLYSLNDGFTFKSKLSHFSSSDQKIVRLEQDKEEHSAVCIINDNEMSESSNSMFDMLVKAATPVSWNK